MRVDTSPTDISAIFEYLHLAVQCIEKLAVTASSCTVKFHRPRLGQVQNITGLLMPITPMHYVV
jgi:hypothetical protein